MKKFVYRYALALVACIMTIFVISCSGGSKGTGSRDYLGRLVDLFGAPLPGVTITIGNTGESAITDDNGDYVVMSSFRDSVIEYFFDSPAISTSATIENVSSAARTLIVDFRVDTTNNSVEPTRIEEIEDEQEGQDDKDEADSVSDDENDDEENQESGSNTPVDPDNDSENSDEEPSDDQEDLDDDVSSDDQDSMDNPDEEAEEELDELDDEDDDENPDQVQSNSDQDEEEDD